MKKQLTLKKLSLLVLSVLLFALLSLAVAFSSSTQAYAEEAATCPDGEHTLGEKVYVLTPQTCVSPGVGVRYCDTCHAAVNVVIPADGISHVVDADGHCKACNAENVGYVITENSPSEEYVEVGPVKDSAATHITIPGTVKTKGEEKKVHVDEEAFKGNTTITSVTIQGAAEIGAGAFSGCENLETVTMEEGTQKIGEGAFEGTKFYEEKVEAAKNSSGLQPISVEIAGGGSYLLKVIDADAAPAGKARANAATPVSFEVPKNTLVIADGAFKDITKLTDVELNAELITVGANAFASANINVYIKDGVKAAEKDGVNPFTNVEGLTGFNNIYYKGGFEEKLADVFKSLLSIIRYYSADEPHSNEHIYWHVEGDLPVLWPQVKELKIDASACDTLKKGAAFTTEGLKVTAVYVDIAGTETEKVLQAGDGSTGYIVTAPKDFDSSKINSTYTVTVSYLTYATATYTVTVKDARVITIDYNDGTTQPMTDPVWDGDPYELPTAPTYEAHKFLGWKVGDDETLKAAKETIESVTSDLKVVAQWAQLYTVTAEGSNVTVAFTAGEEYNDGKTYTNKYYESGKAVTFTVTPAKGYKLVSVMNGNTALTAAADGKYSVTVGTENITVTVTAAEVAVNASFDAQYEGVTAAVAKSDENTKATVTVNGTPTKEGYKFDGWTVTVNGAAATYQNGITIELGNADVTVAFTAQWTQLYTVSYTGGEVIVTFTAGEEYNDGKTYTNKYYESGATVTFTVEPKEGNKLVSVKHGEDTLEVNAEGKYSVTVDKANITIEITTAEIATIEVTADVQSPAAGAQLEEIAGNKDIEVGTTATITFVLAEQYGIMEITGAEVTYKAEKIEGAYKYAVTLTAGKGITLTVKIGLRLVPEAANKVWGFGGSDRIQYQWEWFNGTGVTNGDDGTVVLTFYDVTDWDKDEIQTHDFTSDTPYATYEIQGKTTNPIQNRDFVTWEKLMKKIEAAWPDGVKPERLNVVATLQQIPSDEKAAEGYANSIPVFATVGGRDQVSDQRDVRAIYDPTAPVLDFTEAYLEEEGGIAYMVLIANATNYTAEDVQRIKFVGADSGLTDTQENVATCDEAVQVITIKINVLQIAQKGEEYFNKYWRAHLSLDDNKIEPKVANINVSKTLDVGGYHFVLGNEVGMPYTVISLDPSIRLIEPTGKINFYNPDYFEMWVSTNDLAYIQENVSYVMVEGKRYDFQGRKGFEIVGAAGKINVQASGYGPSEQTSFALTWYNESDELIARTTAVRDPKLKYTLGSEITMTSEANQLQVTFNVNVTQGNVNNARLQIGENSFTSYTFQDGVLKFTVAPNTVWDGDLTVRLFMNEEEYTEGWANFQVNSTAEEIEGAQYTLKIADGALQLNAVRTTPIEKTATFNDGGAVYEVVDGHNRLLIQVKTTGYTTEELKAAQLKIGASKRFDPAPNSAAAPGVNGAMFFYTDGIGELENGNYKLSLCIAGDEYEIYTVIGLPPDTNLTTHEDNGKTITLAKASDGKGEYLEIVISGGEPEPEFSYGVTDVTIEGGEKLTLKITLKDVTGGEVANAKIKINGGADINGTVAELTLTFEIAQETSGNITLTVNDVEYNGAWELSAPITIEFQGYTYTLSAAETTLTLSATIIEYKVTFEADGVDGYPKTETVNFGKPVTVEEPKKDGFVFKGWYYMQGGEEKLFSGESIVPSDPQYADIYDAGTHTITLTAKFEAEISGVKFDFTDKQTFTANVAALTASTAKTPFETACGKSADYEGISNVSQVYSGNNTNGGAHSTENDETTGFIRLGTRSGSGGFTLTFKKEVEKVEIVAEGWTAGSDASIKVEDKDADSSSKPENQGQTTYSYTIPETKSIKIEASVRCFVFSVTVTFAREKTPQEKVDDVAKSYTLSNEYTTYNEVKEYSLPTTTTLEGATISWALKNGTSAYCEVTANGTKLNVTSLPKDSDQEVVLTATFTFSGATATNDFTIKITKEGGEEVFTLNFDSNTQYSNSNATATTSTVLSLLKSVSGGNDSKIESVSTASKISIYKHSSSETGYIKFGSSKADGELTFTLSKKVKKVAIDWKANASTEGQLTVNTQSAPSNHTTEEEDEWTLSTAATSITIASVKRAFIYSITLTFEATSADQGIEGPTMTAFTTGMNGNGNGASAGLWLGLGLGGTALVVLSALSVVVILRKKHD